MVILRDAGHTDANAALLADRMDGVRPVNVSEGEAQVLLHCAQTKVFGVQVNQRA